jgi:5-methylcytosine-specific restriction enzyme A
MPRNPTWQRDELILALDLYFRCNPSSVAKNDPDLVRLSEVLNALPIHQDRPDEERFRNANGVYMKLMNFRSVDPSYTGRGLTGGGKLEAVIWDQFAQDPEHLRRVADAIVLGYQTDLALVREPAREEEEGAFPEGKVLYRVHRVYDRNQKLIRLAKEREMDIVGALRCIACRFDFAKHYGRIGEGYIEAHHTVPISELNPNGKSRLEDIALVCANCHRMLHRRRPWLPLQELKMLVQL